MPKILFINSVSYGSTGKICQILYDLAKEKKFDCCFAYGRGDSFQGYNTIKIGGMFNVPIHIVKSRMLDKHGFGSKYATKAFLKKVEQYNPDVIHLHNLHGYYINVEMLFNYLKCHSSIKVIWTQHDCWSFTGHCAHFLSVECNKWKSHCTACPIISSYPKSFFDNVENNFINKKKAFTSLDNLTVVTPSIWLKELVLDSFLNVYPIEVVHNGIDIGKFSIPNNMKQVKGNKTYILGVSNVWNEKKGIDDFISLANKLDPRDYHITLIGVTKKQKRKLPNIISCVSNTKNIDELVEHYLSADVFFNPTKEDNYPTVNLEAQACGTPVVTYDTGGTSETIYANNCFIIKDLNDFILLLKSKDFKKLKDNFKVDIRKIDKTILLKKYIEYYEEQL